MDLHGILFLLIFFVTNTIMMVTGFAGTMMAHAGCDSLIRR